MQKINRFAYILTDFGIGSLVIIIYIGHYFLPIAYVIFILTQRLVPVVYPTGWSVGLILTDHGLDRMFWKEKGAFILGCSSPLKAIMIDRPGMGKVKSCIAKGKEPEKRSEEKKCEPGEAWERLVLIIKL